jgi:hypothetical protein
MNSIKIIDNFFPQEYIDRIKSFIISNGWLSRCIIRKKHDTVGAYAYWIIDVKTNPLFCDELMNIIQKKLNKKFLIKNSSIIGNFFTQDATYHEDSINEKRLTYTLCLYLNELNTNNIEDSDGSLYIKIPDEKYIIEIESIINRAVFFPAHYIHKGMSFNKNSNSLRCCVTWKLLEQSE